jgi:hypothetical protein
MHENLNKHFKFYGQHKRDTSGSLKLLKPSGPVKACYVIALPLLCGQHKQIL